MDIIKNKWMAVICKYRDNQRFSDYGVRKTLTTGCRPTVQIFSQQGRTLAYSCVAE
jgi:hypothetical protein